MILDLPCVVASLPHGEAGRDDREGDGRAGEGLVVRRKKNVLHLFDGAHVRGLALDDVGWHELSEEVAVVYADVGERGLVAPELPIQGVDEAGQGFMHIPPDVFRPQIAQRIMPGCPDVPVHAVVLEDFVHIAAGDDEQVGQPRGSKGRVRRVDRELLHLPQKGEKRLGGIDFQPPAHRQPFQRDVAGGVVEAVRASDVVGVVDVDEAHDLGFDAGVGPFLPLLFPQGIPQVVQGVHLHEGLGHLIVEGDDVLAADVGVAVDGVIGGGGFNGPPLEELPAHPMQIELVGVDAFDTKKLFGVFLEEPFDESAELRVVGLGVGDHASPPPSAASGMIVSI